MPVMAGSRSTIMSPNARCAALPSPVKTFYPSGLNSGGQRAAIPSWRRPSSTVLIRRLISPTSSTTWSAGIRSIVSANCCRRTGTPRAKATRLLQSDPTSAGLRREAPPLITGWRWKRRSREAPRPTIVVSRDDLCLMTPSSLSVRHLLSATAERPFTRAGPMVRIRFPPPMSPSQQGPADAVDRKSGFRAGSRNGTPPASCGGAEITELIHILDGTATLEIVCDDGPPRSFVLPAGTIAVNPQGAWHRLHPSEGVTSMTATPSPREVIELDVDDPRTVECKPA